MFAGLEGAKKEGGVKDRPRKAEVDECGADKVVWLLVVNRLFMKGFFAGWMSVVSGMRHYRIVEQLRCRLERMR